MFRKTARVKKNVGYFLKTFRKFKISCRFACTEWQGSILSTLSYQYRSVELCVSPLDDYIVRFESACYFIA